MVAALRAPLRRGRGLGGRRRGGHVALPTAVVFDSKGRYYRRTGFEVGMTEARFLAEQLPLIGRSNLSRTSSRE